MPGQTVPAGAALFEVVNLDRVWVRVPVYAGDLPELDSGPWASVGGLTARPGEPSRPAKLVTTPLSATPANGTVDLFYETLNPVYDPLEPGDLPNPPDLTPRRWRAVRGLLGFGLAAYDGPQYTPGQRVAVTLRLKDPADSLSVPWSAVVYDIHGGAWVYEPTGERSYTRRRVVVRHVVNDTAVLASGPTAGTTVVIAGAAELFGAETGYSK